MTASLTCTQVSALLSFYIDDKLSSQLTQFVEAHLEKCPLCRAKYETLKSMVTSLRVAQEKLATVKTSDDEKVVSSHCEEFKTNLSAYVDNELSDADNIKVRKYVISNAQARGELESMYKLKKAMHNSFEKTENESKYDFSKFIMNRIDMQEEIYGSVSYAKVAAIFLFIFALFTVTAVVILWI